MRIIGQIENESDARSFSDFLLVQGIENEIEPDKQGHWAVWVHSEDEMDKAKEWFSQFRLNPLLQQFRAASNEASELREKKRLEQESFARRFVDRSQLVPRVSERGQMPLTLILIILSVMVFVVYNTQPDLVRQHLLISGNPPRGDIGQRLMGMTEVWQGQVWRLVTPIFIHFGFLHILFNMMWLWDLGGMIESQLSTRKLGLLVLAMAVFPNIAEYLGGTFLFGGMSGVVYGLLGYVWIRGKLDPASGLFLHPSTVTMMMIWYFVCLLGLIGNVANIVHTVGLGMGMAWGFLDSRRRLV